MRQQVGYIHPGSYYGSFSHPYDYPPIVTLIDMGTREEVSGRIIQHFGLVEIHLNVDVIHNGLEVWA